MKLKEIITIVGPTASGKSGLALEIAKKINGSVVNADAMQIYKDLSIVTARPTETQNVPHLLYGYLDAYSQGTVQDWLNRVVPILESTKNPILVGGTGLYLSSLINGINDIPEVNESIRSQVRKMNIQEIKKQVKECSFTDPQRLMRALEVQLSTGKTIHYFQNKPKKKLIKANFKVIFVNPPRDILYKRCEERFIEMLEEGGIQEVQKLLQLNPTGGILKAIGVPEIIQYLDKKLTKQELIEKAVLSTRHYAKRQITWFKHQLKTDIILSDPKEFSTLKIL